MSYFGTIYADTELADRSRNCRSNADHTVIRSSDRFCDKHTFTAGQAPSDCAEQASQTFILGIHFSLQGNILHICHSSAFNFYRLAAAE